MNKQFYRTKFNAKLGTYVAVSELAKSHQGDISPRIKASIDTETTNSSIATTGQRTLKQLVLALSGLMAFSPIYANVVVNNNAAAAHKATVLKEGNAANVWITAPSASGVSRNSYTQFDVNQNGVILNNSRGAATSQITKTSIAANPNLAKGAATTIVNEVVSTNPSLLQGNLEVLGSRANVVIANPTGITVNGGGFINANQVTLSTGVLGYNSDGSIKQHTVKQGAITINPDANNRGLGGNANNPVALELLGRSIAINAPVNATTITAVTGANIVAADTGEFTATTGAGTKPTVAIDIAQLGGLYANSIYLYANEAGVGVNNAGVIQAQNNVVLNSNGKIEHKGTISSTSKTQSLVSISTRGTGTAGDINSSGSINGYGFLNIDAGNNINVNAKDITLNYEGIASSPLILSAKGNLNLAAGTKVANLGTLGDLYIDAENINLGADTELRSNRGSAVIQANNSLVSNKAGFVAAKDLTLSGNANLKLTDTRLHASTGDIYLQSTSKDKVGNDINVQGGSVYAAKGLTIYSDKDATINNLNFLKKANSTQAQVNSINAYAGNNLNFSTTNQEFPYTSGKIQLGAGNQLTLEGKDQNSKLSGGGGLKLSGKNITTKNIYMTGSGAYGVDIVSDGGDILLDQGSRIWGNTGDININALNGNITANSLKATTGGKIAILANNNVELNSLQKTATPVAGKDTLTTDKSVIGGQKGVTIGSIGEGNVKINATNLTAQQGEIQLTSQNGITLDKNVDVTLKNDTLSNGVVSSVLNGQAISIDNNKSNIQIADTQLNATTGKLLVSSKAGMTTIKDSVLTSKGNTELHAKDLLTLQGVTATSDQHLAVNSGRTVYINAEYTPATVWIPNKVTNLTSKGVTSVTAIGNQVLQNANITGGAVLMEAGGFILGQTGMNYNATGSDLIKNDTKLNSLNGDLSIQTGRDLTIDPTKHKLSAVGDIDLVSKSGALILNGYGGTAGNGSEKVVSLNTANGGINLQGNKVELRGSQLNAAKDISVVSTGGDLIVDGVRNTIINQHTDVYKEKIKNLSNEEKVLQESDEYKNAMAFVTQEFTTLSKRIESGELVAGGDAVWNEIQKIINVSTKKFPNYVSKANQIKEEQDYYSEMLKLFNVGYVNGEVHTGAKVISDKGNIQFVSNKGLSISGSSIDAKSGKVNLEAAGTLDGEGYNIQGNYNNSIENSVKKGIIKGSIIIDANQDSYEQGSPSGNDYRWFSPVSATSINGAKGVSIKATGKQATDNLILQGVSITSDGDVNIEAYKNIIFDVAINNSFNKSQKSETKRKWYGKKKTITTIQTSEQSGGLSVDIDANNINIKSQEKNTAAMTGQNRTSIDMYSSQLTAIDGKINIQAGGDLNFLTANDETLNTTDISKKSSFLGVKLNKSHTTNTRNVKSELPAVLNANYIGTKSGFDTRLKGTVFNYLEGANIQAGGTITLEGASTTVTETLKKESNSVVWQSMQDKGSITETAELPSFKGPVAPTFIAKGGLTVQVPVVSGKNNDVRAEVIKLSNQPGNEYLKALIARKDVNWEAVKLAQENWDYKSQGLTGAGAALIVIIVTVLTSGAGSAAATSVTSATGVASLGASAQAAVATLATQASVSLINNGGDLGKTLKDLGSKESVRGLVTSVVTAGLLNQVGTALNLKPDSTLLSDRLMNNFTNAVGSTLVQTAINGGNLQDNLEKALLAGLSGALQGELASQIGTGFGKVDPGTLEYVLHKIAHAAAGCATAAVTDSSCGAGAIGAGVGEIVAELMIPEGKTALDLTEAERKSIKDTSKIVAGSVAAFAGYDVVTAANKAETTVENNALAKVLTTAGKAAYKVAKVISEMPAAARAKLKPSEITEMLRKEGVQGVIDIGDNLITLVSPSSTMGDRAFALIDLAIGVDLKAGKNVDVLKVDQKVLVKNLGTSTTKNAIIAAAKESNLKNLDLPINGKVFKPDANLSSGAAVYKGASNEDIYTAFKDIAGIRTLPSTGNPMYQPIKGKTSLSGQPGYIIRVPQADGSTVVLRNFSLSQTESQARFTIDIQKPAGMKVNKLELKFQ
ncbi:DUF637 domain-containing protein [Acinetobacter courvalinii]|uniref:Hemagglutinin n=1 Tax=Acinetobacter courvalinii TaxID=280147 RepID=N9RE77_9GAMM|nr:DUF637 domain-containing protein [Acinetobacter courvalinii]ENX37447.1 hypothetical protein F888_02784 [Acinetobacter courvalinii]GGH27283.1 hemagglutinin [Acinetobacter courvalinii]